MRALSLLAVIFFAVFALPAQPANALTATRTVTIDDGANLLSPAQEETLKQDTAGIDLPESVTQVVYLTFASNDDELNDTVRYYTADHGMHSPNGEKYADGLLFSVVGMNPRSMGIYCGDDVCRDLEIYDATGTTDSLRLDAITDAMRPLLQDEKWEQGLLRGIQASADLGVRNEPYTGPGPGRDVAEKVDKAFSIFDYLFKFNFVFIFLVGCYILWKNFKRRGGSAREDYNYIIAHHGDIANRLQEIDVRAHSLSSDLADDTLRSQWQDIRDKFLAAHESMSSLSGLSHSSSNRQFQRKASALATARKAVESVVNAEANIEELASMEHGDASVRRRELTSLHEDVLLALAKAKSPLSGQLDLLNNRILRLRDDVESPYFMDTFTRILGDYKVLVEELERQEFKRSKADKTATTLGSADWHPGVGSYYVPYSLIDSWHTRSSSSSRSWSSSSSSFSSSSSYSSSGFSGGGGSSRF